MAASPFREQRFSAGEVRRIVKRAAELAELDPDAEGAGQALTRDEIEERAASLGLPGDAVRRAIDSPSAAPAAAPDGTVRVVHDEALDGELPVERHEEIAELIQAAVEQPGRVQVVGKKITWTPAHHVGSDFAVTVHSKNGRTRVRVEQTISRRGQLIGATFGLGLLSVLPIVGIALDAFKSPALAAVSGLIAFAATFAGLGALFRRSGRKRAVALERIMQRVRAGVQAAVQKRSASATRARIEAPAAADESEAAETEAAEAEAAAADLPARGKA